MMNKFYIKITEKKGYIKSEFDVEAGQGIKLWLAKEISADDKFKNFIKEAIVLAEQNIDYEDEIDKLY